MSFPVTIRHRDAKAKIYRKSPDYPYYRIAYRVGGKRLIKHFPSFGEAKAAAQKAVREISKGSQALALSNKEAANALAIREKLESFRQDTGRSVNALEAVS